MSNSKSASTRVCNHECYHHHSPLFYFYFYSFFYTGMTLLFPLSFPSLFALSIYLNIATSLLVSLPPSPPLQCGYGRTTMREKRGWWRVGGCAALCKHIEIEKDPAIAHVYVSVCI
uniref:Uncharacterized protein n=1 Tax=Palpitomonas bilix TaxID=652834 RepID=A0A7S3D066_9EUKA|mmetsp:Transcript_16772/g.42119  ORF Transcript_16772/g.42119 Transcript_16772/m.42119 type:complete len:116 (+) Transcript_16772:231-578(+)